MVSSVLYDTLRVHGTAFSPDRLCVVAVNEVLPGKSEVCSKCGRTIRSGELLTLAFPGPRASGLVPYCDRCRPFEDVRELDATQAKKTGSVRAPDRLGV